MKLIHLEILAERGPFSQSNEWAAIRREVSQAISKVVWPPRSESFTIRSESGKKRGEGNGVKPIKATFVRELVRNGWRSEVGLDYATTKGNPGAIDAAKQIGAHMFAAEWETGNISSSHRALNKMALGLIRGRLVGGILVLPTRALYRFLTDRIGNYDELEPYFDLWRSIAFANGVLAVAAVEHDATSTRVRRIPKGTDGRALA